MEVIGRGRARQVGPLPVPLAARGRTFEGQGESRPRGPPLVPSDGLAPSDGTSDGRILPQLEPPDLPAVVRVPQRGPIPTAVTPPGREVRLDLGDCWVTGAGWANCRSSSPVFASQSRPVR